LPPTSREGKREREGQKQIGVEKGWRDMGGGVGSGAGHVIDFFFLFFADLGEFHLPYRWPPMGARHVYIPQVGLLGHWKGVREIDLMSRDQINMLPALPTKRHQFLVVVLNIRFEDQISSARYLLVAG
jgi:hypothetical protein